jgi:hypothetical protein
VKHAQDGSSSDLKGVGMSWWVPEMSAPWRVRASTASVRASSGSMPRSSMFSRTMTSKASCEIAIAISSLRLWIPDLWFRASEVKRFWWGLKKVYFTLFHLLSEQFI